MFDVQDDMRLASCDLCGKYPKYAFFTNTRIVPAHRVLCDNSKACAGAQRPTEPIPDSASKRTMELNRRTRPETLNKDCLIHISKSQR